MSQKIAIFTLGCRVNHYESAAIADSARECGFEVVGWDEPADFGVVNSCALTVLAEAKTRQAIRIFARANPHCAIAVSGCYAQTDPHKIAELPNVKWVVCNALKARAAEIIKRYPPAEEPLVLSDSALPASPEASRGNTPLDDRMNLKIQDGCDNACAYCIIPRARGLPRSRAFGDIVRDAENLVSRGVREIILTGINIAKFSSPEGGLADLADRLDKIPELLRLRLGSIEPPHFELDALLERMADSSHKLAPHLHISSQSLSDNVLSAMRRKYAYAEFAATLEKIRNKSEYIAVGTDLICGHPREAEEDFALTKSRLLSSGMAYAHVFTFSPRPKTLAAVMDGQVPAEIRKARAVELRKTAEEIRSKFAEKNVGKIREVLLENRLANGDYLGYTDNYMQVAVNIPQSGLKNRLALAEIVGKIGRERVAARLERLL